MTSSATKKKRQSVAVYDEEAGREYNLSSSSAALIPGLPDEIATLCILRVSADSLPSCRRVSKGWNSILARNERISTLRKKLGFRDPWLVVTYCEDETERIHVKVLNLSALLWHTLRPTPDLYWVGGNFFTTASIPQKGIVFFFGGVACFGSAANVFLKYEARDDRWTVIKAMTGELGSLTAGVVDDKVYLTGLKDKGLSDREHDRVEVYDPEKGTLEKATAAATTTTESESSHIDFDWVTVFDGKLFLTQDYWWDSSCISEIYDPRSGEWERMSQRLRQGICSGPGVEVYGRLFALDPDGRDFRSGLKVYDAESDCWDAVEGNYLPRRVGCRPHVCSLDDKIYVVTYGVMVGTISKTTTTETKRRRPGRAKYSGFRVEWEIIADETSSNSSSMYTLCAKVIIAA